MKRYLFVIVCCIAAAITYAECITETGSTVTISRWYDFYTPVYDGEMMCWNIELSGEGPYQIRYNIDLDQFECLDMVCIYEIGDGDSSHMLRTFLSTTESGAMVSNSNRFRIEYYGFTGKQVEELYDGFQLYFEPATSEYMVNHDFYVLGRLGVGTTHINSRSTLHVNGAIYGGEQYGATRFVSDVGYVTIGTATENRNTYTQFKTDRDKYVFNKPVYVETGVLGSSTDALQFTVDDSVRVAINGGNVGIGVENPQEALHVNGAIRGGGANGQVTLKGDSGYVTIGASGQAMEFITDKEQYVFDKPIYNQSGTYNVQNSNLSFNINDTTHMIILQNNGNVGIGVSNPKEILHIAGPIRGDGTSGALRIRTSMGTTEIGPTDSGYSRFNTTLGGFYFNKKLILETGIVSSAVSKPLYFKIGDAMTPLYISTTGNVGIGTQNPNYKLDVNGTIRANEIIVNTTGADFVFAEDYQLRPLSEVKAFIQENKHLPEIKSAQEMQENGVGINELQTQLLQKIEELTLYLIQQEQTIQELRQEIELLKM